MTFTTTPRRLAKTLAIAAGLSFVSLSAFAAGDAALYGPTAPKGSSFVRIYNASNQEVSATVGSTNLSDVAPLAGSGQPQLIEEPPFKNKQKSLVRVQNLSDKALTLKTADGKTDVVKSVAAKGRGEREINPVKVSLALYDGDKKVGDVKPVALERGEAAVLYVTGSGSSLSPVWVKRPVSTR